MGYRSIASFLLCLTLGVTGYLPASAATFTVNSTADVVDESPGNGKCQDHPSTVCTTDADCTDAGLVGPCNLCDTGRTAPPAPATPECTLRAAIQEANASTGADAIDLPAGTYTLTIAGAAEDGAASGDLDITQDLTLNGAGADTTIVSGVAGDRVLHVDPHGAQINVSISGVTVQHGSTVQIPFVASRGGGILLGSTQSLGDPIPSGTLTLTDCVIQANMSVGNGGGVATHGAGGGAFVAGCSLELTNSTVSGNTPSGLFLYNDAGSGPKSVNNSTIANNSGIGIITVSPGGVGPSLLNTIVADNAGPDCLATPLSQGYNLVESVFSGVPNSPPVCSLVGDTTGNIIGQDPQLGPLANNGSATHTHALLSNSPAIDAGNPAAPGSGGNACTATDQRGFVRPFGAACDIGAFERTSTLSVSSAVPNHGGQTGSVTTFIYGSGFESGAMVTLRRMGEPDITGNPATVDVDGSVIAATFDLSSAATGARDLIVTNPDGTSASRSQGFAIEETRPPQLWMDVIGPTKARIGQPERYFVLFGNRGNVDAPAVPFGFALPRNFDPALEFDVLPPPPHPDQVPTDWELAPITVMAH